jgi:hypothetical protein
VPGRIVALAVGAALLLTGCAEQHAAGPPVPATSPSAVASASPSASVPSALNTPTPAPTLSPAPTAGTVHLTVHRAALPPGVRRGPEWLVVSAAPASTSVTIAWTDAVSAECGAVQDVWVQETSDAVVLDLVHSAHRAGAVCPMVLAPRRATVPLAAPLGSRTLEEHVSTPTAGDGPCPSPGPISQGAQTVCPLTTKG